MIDWTAFALNWRKASAQTKREALPKGAVGRARRCWENGTSIRLPYLYSWVGFREGQNRFSSHTYLRPLEKPSVNMEYLLLAVPQVLPVGSLSQVFCRKPSCLHSAVDPCRASYSARCRQIHDGMTNRISQGQKTSVPLLSLDLDVCKSHQPFLSKFRGPWTNEIA